MAEVISPEGDVREYKYGEGGELEAVDRREPVEKLQDAFGELVGQLEGINANLSQQMAQQERLMERVEKLPDVLESFPGMVENQRILTEQMLQQLAIAVAKSDQFLDSVDRIPEETAKQTESLRNIHRRLSASAETEARMADSFGKFNGALEILSNTAASQTDSICQLSRTFAASDRYFKYMMRKQSRRFFWVFMVAMGVCTGAIGTLVGVLVYVLR